MLQPLPPLLLQGAVRANRWLLKTSQSPHQHARVCLPTLGVALQFVISVQQSLHSDAVQEHLQLLWRMARATCRECSEAFPYVSFMV